MANHRSGKLKQSNKRHKTPGTTKGSKDQRVQGRVASARPPPKKTSATASASGGKQQRLQRQRQRIQQQRQEVMLQKRVGSGSLTGVPRIVTILCLHANASPRRVLQALRHADLSLHPVGQAELDDDMVEGEEDLPAAPRYEVFCRSSKTAFTFLTPPPPAANGAASVVSLIDQLVVSDAILILLEEDDGDVLVDEGGRRLLDLLPHLSLGGLAALLPPTAAAVNSASRGRKVAAEAILSGLEGIVVLQGEDRQWPRRLAERCNGPRWRQTRSFLFAEKLEFVEEEQEREEEEEEQHTLRLTGPLRGPPLDLRCFLHLPGLGVVTMKEVRRLPPVANGEQEEQEEVVEIEPVPADDLLSEIQSDAEGHDGLAGEQTWPTESEMVGEPLDDNELEEEEEEEEEEDPEALLDAYFQNEYKEDKKRKDLDDDELALEAEADDANNNNNKAQQQGEEEDEDDALCEEVDLPHHLSARQRWARYRALRSFKNSFWHCKENLPRQYARIFQVEDGRSLQRAVVAEAEAAQRKQQSILAQSKSAPKGPHHDRLLPFLLPSSSSNTSSQGMDTVDDSSSSSSSRYVCSEQFVEIIATVRGPRSAAQLLVDRVARGRPLAVFALHREEVKKSVSHFQVQRLAASPLPPGSSLAVGYDGLIRSKDLLLCHMGFRWCLVKPIFSEISLQNDKQKLLRVLPREGFHCMSAICPISLTTQEPVSVFRVNQEDGSITLLAHGALQTIDPDRIILKRIVLSGNPVRVHKRMAVIKSLFRDPADVRYFRPAELVTRAGLRGHIKCSVGMHGLCKVLFSAPIVQSDEVMLVLYKRVYPKLLQEEDKAPLQALLTNSAAVEVEDGEMED